MEPSAGYTITYRQGNGLEPTSATQIPMPLKNNSLRVEVDVHAAPLLLASDLGVYAYNVIA